MAGGAGHGDHTPSPRFIRLRYGGSCVECEEEVERGTRAWWDSSTKTVVCTRCRPEDPVGEHVRGDTGGLDVGIAGGSAQETFEGRHQKRETQIERRWGRLAGVVKFLSDDPRSTTAWAQGSAGERILAQHLSTTLGDRAVLLHDRRVPGSRANIDHIVVAGSGVWVIDTKRWSGLVELRDVGGWFKVDRRLYVGGRDRTKAVEGMTWQIESVTRALEEVAVEPPLHAALCFVDAEWRWFAKPFHLDGVRISGPKSLGVAIAEEGPLGRDEVLEIAQTLASALPSKTL